MDILEYIKQMQEIYGDKVITTADKLEKPPKTVVREMFQNAFTDNKAYGGRAGYNDGQLVTPSVDGSRPGYRGKNLDRAAYKEIRPITKANIDNYAFFTSKAEAAKYKFKVQLPSGTEVFKTKKEAQAAIDAAPITNKDYTKGLIDFKVPQGATNFDKGRVKISTGEFIGEGRDKSEIFKIQNKDGSNVRYTSSGAGGGKRKFYKSIEKVKKAKLDFLPDELVKIDSKLIKEGIKEVTYKNKKTNKIVKYYKPRVGEAKETIPGKGTTSLKEAEKFIKDYYVKNPKPVRDPKKNYASKDVRTKSLKETDPTKAIGTKNYNYHHIRQIAGGVPLTSDDVMIINQRINSKIGGKFNEPLNRISTAIQKNNRLALEAMNAKEEGLALDYMKRVDDLNAQAEKIVNSAIDDLPKKYKSYVGFNQFTLPRDEYGLPISNEPMLIRKVGGMPVSKDAIDLTTLSTKDEATFRKIVKQQAEAGKTGPINTKKLKQDFLKLSGTKNKKCKGLLSYGGRAGLAEGLSPEFCINEGKKVARDLVAKNIKASPAQNLIMNRITSGVKNFVKSILDPKELFDIKKQLFSKGALVSVPIFDAVMAADDALRKDMDPKEAFAKTFTFGTIPRAMGFTDSIDVINAKKMLEDPSLSPAGKEYAQLIIDRGNYEKIQSDTTGGMTKKFTEFKEMQEKIKNASTAGRFDYEKLLTEKEATEKAGEYVGEPQKVGPGTYVAFDGEKVRKVNEFGYARKGTTFDAPDKPDVTPLVNKLATRAKSRGPMTEMKKQKVDYTPLTYESYKPYSFTKEEFEDTMRQEGLLKENEIYDDTFYKEQIETPMRAEQFKEYMELPSFKGSQFASGGLANLTDTIPPESGPMSEGLRSLYNNGRKL